MPEDAVAGSPIGPTDLDRAVSLPRIEAGAASALSRLYSRAGPAALVIRGKPCVLHWDFERPPMAEERRYRFTLGQQIGHLGLDFFAEALLLGGERNANFLPRELRYLLLADALQPLVQRAQRLSGLRFEWSPPELDEQPDGPGHAEYDALFRIEDAAGTAARGFIHFEDSTGLECLVQALSAAVALPVRRTLGWLRFPVSFVIGTTRVPLQTVRHIEHGDIIAIDVTQPTESGLRVTGRIEGATGVEVQALAEAARITVYSWRSDPTMTQTHDAASPESPGEANAGASPPDTWDSLQVPLRFEIGDLSISLADLRSLQPGYVFELKQPLNRGEVRILAHGRLLGTGYLVAVGDHLGVRVTEFVAGADE